MAGNNGNDKPEQFAEHHVEKVNSLQERYQRLDDRVSHVDSQVGKIWSSLGETRQELAGLGAQVGGMRDALNKLVDKMDRPPQQFNWGWLLAALALVLSMATTFTTMNISPVVKQLDRVTERQSDTLENGTDERVKNAHTLGKIEAQIASEIKENEGDDEDMHLIMKELYDLQRRVGHIEGEGSHVE